MLMLWQEGQHGGEQQHAPKPTPQGLTARGARTRAQEGFVRREPPLGLVGGERARPEADGVRAARC